MQVLIGEGKQDERGSREIRDFWLVFRDIRFWLKHDELFPMTVILNVAAGTKDIDCCTADYLEGRMEILQE